MSTPRHRDPTKFGFTSPSGWVPFEVTEGKLIYACGHTGRVVVGAAPDKTEEEVKTFLARTADRVCPKCLPTSGRIRYETHEGD